MASPSTILVFGDSLSAAYGIRPEQGWVALLAQRLTAQGYGYQVINASVSGETSGGGRERLPRYTEEFARVFPEVANQYHLPLVPFLLDKVALNATLMQPDGLHPDAAGEPAVLETLWPYLKPMLHKNPKNGGR